jgi:hypothetical protein
MKKLSLPTVDFCAALSAAISGIGNEDERAVYTDAFDNPAAMASHYEATALAANLYAEPRLTTTDDPVVLGGLHKSQLTKLYSQYFVPEKKPARRFYETLKVTANGKCPLCGGIGHVRTLDHYLPKANFPIYSVLPTNLVPCCRDCNSEKLNAFADIKENQTLHPYFDNDRFFNEKWIYARVIQQIPPVLDYYVAPPENWAPEDKSRAQSHFDEYSLADKFSVEAAADIPETIQTRRTIMAHNTPEEFSLYLAEKGQTDTIPINNWRRVMFLALATDSWFCSQTFADPF